MGDISDYYREHQLNQHLDPAEYGMFDQETDFTQWTMKNGKTMPLSSMTDTHLMNSIDMLKRDNPTSNWIEYLMIELESR